MGSPIGNLHRAQALKHNCPQDRLNSQSEQLFPCFDFIMPERQKGLSVSKAVLKKPFPLRGFAQVLPFSSSSSSSFLKLPTCKHFLLMRKFKIPFCSSDQRCLNYRLVKRTRYVFHCRLKIALQNIFDN